MFPSPRHAAALPAALLLLVLASVPAAASTAAPMPPAPAGSDTLARDDDPMHHGAGTSYMVGRSLLDSGDAASALPYLGQAYRLEPEVAEFGEAFLDALLREGYGREALRVTRDLRQRRPDDFALGEREVLILTGLEMYDESLAALAAMRAVHADSTQLVLLRAEVQARARRDADALASYREALDLRPDEREDIYLAMCRLAERAGFDQLRGPLWREALHALPESRLIRLGALRHLVGIQSFDAAQAVAEAGDAMRAASDEPDEGPSWRHMLAELLERAGRYPRAAALLRPEAAAGTLPVDGMLLLARLEAGIGNVEAAVGLLRSSAGRWPDDPLVHLDLGRLLADSGDLAGGEAEIRRALAIAPNQPAIPLALISLLMRRHPYELQPGGRAPRGELHDELAELADSAAIMLGDEYPRSNMLLAIAFHGAGRLERAAEQYEYAARDPGLRRDALLSLSFVHEELEAVDEMLGVLEILISDHPEDPDIQNAMGYGLADAGRELDRAEDLIRKALAQDPENGAYLDSLGWVLFRRGDFAGAFDHLVNAANARPEDPVILEHLGRALLALDRPARALEILKRARAAGNDDLDALISELEDGP